MSYGFEHKKGRLLLFIDMDSFFASVEQQCNPWLRKKSMGVVRKPYMPSVVSAPSREAKKLGIKTGCLTTEAFRIDRRFRVILEDPEKYVYASSQVFRILADYTPWLKVMSIDEGWIDITQITKEQYGGDPLAVACEIKKRIKDKLGHFITASIGIAPSKILSKYAGESKKPNGLVWIKEDEIPSLLDRLEVDSMCGINKGYKRRLMGLGIYTLGELGRCSITKLRKVFGIFGYYLHLIGKGLDSPMMDIDYVGRARKGYSHGRVLRADSKGKYGDLEDNKDILKILCMETARRMRTDGKLGRVIHFSATSKVGVRVGRQRALPHPTGDPKVIFNTCMFIAQELIREGKYVAELDGIDVHVGKLSNAKSITLPLFTEDRKRLAVLDAIDAISDKFGDKAVYTLDMLKALENYNWGAQSRGMYRNTIKYIRLSS